MIGVIKIIQHIDATAKNNALVHHTQFAVQPAPALGHQQAKARGQWRVGTPLDTRIGQIFFPRLRKRSRANGIDQDLNPHPTSGSPNQGIRHISACAMKIKNIGFQLYPAFSRIKSLDECREQRLSALKQLERFGISG